MPASSDTRKALALSCARGRVAEAGGPDLVEARLAADRVAARHGVAAAGEGPNAQHLSQQRAQFLRVAGLAAATVAQSHPEVAVGPEGHGTAVVVGRGLVVELDDLALRAGVHAVRAGGPELVDADVPVPQRVV